MIYKIVCCIHVIAYFYVVLMSALRIEVIQSSNSSSIQKSLQMVKDLKIKKVISHFPSRLGRNRVSPPSQPSPPPLLFSNA
jgi:hypothetical protein